MQDPLKVVQHCENGPVKISERVNWSDETSLHMIQKKTSKMTWVWTKIKGEVPPRSAVKNVTNVMVSGAVSAQGLHVAACGAVETDC